MTLWGPDQNDRFKNRRKLAFWSAIFALIIWPHEIIYFTVVHGITIDLAKALLLYVTTLAGTTIGGYLWASIRNDRNNKGGGE